MGGLISGFGDVQNSQAQMQMAKIYVDQGNTNQTLANLAATDATNRGEQTAGRIALQAGRTIGAQTAGYAASGVDTQSGSPLEAMLDSRMMSAYDQSIVRNNAAREAFGLKVKGFQAYQQGQLNAFGASNNATASNIKAAGDVASTAGQMVSLLG